MPTTVTLSWDELLVDPQLVKEGLAKELRGILEHPDFRASIRDAIKQTGPELIAKAVAETVNYDLIHFMRSKVQPLKDELNAVVKDFDHLERTHASDYAAQRKKALLAKLSELNSL